MSPTRGFAMLHPRLPGDDPYGVQNAPLQPRRGDLWVAVGAAKQTHGKKGNNEFSPVGAAFLLPVTSHPQRIRAEAGAMQEKKRFEECRAAFVRDI